MDKRKRTHWERLLQTPVIEAVPFRRNWLLKTREGDWVAKRVTRPGHLKWWLQVDQELRVRGFHGMPPIRSDGSRWLLTPLIEGRVAHYRNKEDITKTAQLLAHFHRVGYWLSIPKQRSSRHLLERMDHRLRDFSLLMQQMDRIEGKIGHLLRVHGGSFYQEGIQARKRLARLPLGQLIVMDRTSFALTHRDLASHNILIDRQGTAWLIDFDSAEYDCQLGDLWQLLSRALSEQGWERSIWNDVLSSYEAIRPLQPVESAILPELLAFPNEFYREALGLAQKKRGYTAAKTLPYLEWIVQTRPAWQRLVRELSYW